MSRIHAQAAGRMQSIARNPIMIALFASLALAACAKKPMNSAGDLGLGANAATPGSTQDFTVNVGDRIFFDTDSTSIRADAQQRSIARLSGWPSIRTTPSRSKVTPTNAAPANTTWHLAHAVPHPPRIPLLARYLGLEDQDNLVRQGKAGRRLRRHFLLVAEPPCRHGSRWRRHVIAGLHRRPIQISNRPCECSHGRFFTSRGPGMRSDGSRDLRPVTRVQFMAAAFDALQLRAADGVGQSLAMGDRKDRVGGSVNDKEGNA
jgi:hypothetical protein